MKLVSPAVLPILPPSFAQAAIKFREAQDHLVILPNARQSPAQMVQAAVLAASAGVDLLAPFAEGEPNKLTAPAQAAITAAKEGNEILLNTSPDGQFADGFLRATEKFRDAEYVATHAAR